jgi:hypothetical protein
MNILLGEFSAEVGKEDFFKPTIWNESLHKFSNDNGIRVVNFATSKIFIVKNTVSPHCNIHKFTSTPPDGNNQICHIFMAFKCT